MNRIVRFGPIYDSTAAGFHNSFDYQISIITSTTISITYYTAEATLGDSEADDHSDYSSDPEYASVKWMEVQYTNFRQAEVQDAGIRWVEVPNKRVEVPDTRVGQVVTPIQYRRGLRSQITLGEEII